MDMLPWRGADHRFAATPHSSRPTTTCKFRRPGKHTANLRDSWILTAAIHQPKLGVVGQAILGRGDVAVTC